MKLGLSLQDIEAAPAVDLDWLLAIDSTIAKFHQDKAGDT